MKRLFLVFIALLMLNELVWAKDLPPQSPQMPEMFIEVTQEKQLPDPNAVEDQPGAQPSPDPASTTSATPCIEPPALTDYAIGTDDVLEVSVLKPEELLSIVAVAPDGTISFPYIGSVEVRGRSIAQVQEEIQARLGDGYMKYPIVTVSLKESRSRKFFVYGQVLKPGSYPIEENMTVLRAISMAEDSRVLVLQAG